MLDPREPAVKGQHAHVRLKHRVEYAALRAVAWLVLHLPYRAALAVGWIIAALFFHVFRFRVRECYARMRQVLGPTVRPRNLAWRSWRNIVFSAVEMCRAPLVSLQWVDRYCDCEEAMRVLKRHHAGGEGAIIACPHMGSWETAAAICRVIGLPMFSIAGKQRNPLVNSFLTSLRERARVDTVIRGRGTMREVIRRLRSGGMLAILPDVRIAEGGVPIEFLGSTAHLGPGMALFARHTGATIFPCIVTRQGWTRHRVEIHAPVRADKELDKQEDVRRITQSVMDLIAAAVRDDPGQWFWFNKRWVLDPVPDAPEGGQSEGEGTRRT